MNESLPLTWSMAPLISTKLGLQPLNKMPVNGATLLFTEQQLTGLPRRMLPRHPIACLDTISTLVGDFTNETRRVALRSTPFPIVQPTER